MKEVDNIFGSEYVEKKAKKLKVKKAVPATKTVEVAPKGQEPEEEKEVTPIEVIDDCATVHVGMSYTKNLGNYESCKYTVSITMPCDPLAVDSTYDASMKWVDEKLATAIGEIQKDLEPSEAPDEAKDFDPFA